MRQKVFEAAVATASIIYDYFSVSITYQCYTDGLSIGQANDLKNQVYIFGTPTTFLPLPVFEHSASSSCKTTYKLYGYNMVSDAWDDYSTCSCLDYIIYSFNTATGQVLVKNSNGTKTTLGDLNPFTVL